MIRPVGDLGPGRTDVGRASGATTKKPPVRREGVWNMYGCKRKGMGGGRGKWGQRREFRMRKLSI